MKTLFRNSLLWLVFTLVPVSACAEGKTTHITQADFFKKVWNYQANSKDWKYIGDKPCIVDFYASWCGPCKMLSPILEELAAEYDGKIYIYKVDTEKERQLAADFQIRSLPTILFCPQKGAPQGVIGYKSKAELKKIIDEFLLKK